MQSPNQRHPSSSQQAHQGDRSASHSPTDLRYSSHVQRQTLADPQHYHSQHQPGGPSPYSSQSQTPSSHQQAKPPQSNYPIYHPYQHGRSQQADYPPAPAHVHSHGHPTPSTSVGNGNVKYSHPSDPRPGRSPPSYYSAPQGSSQPQQQPQQQQQRPSSSSGVVWGDSHPHPYGDHAPPPGQGHGHGRYGSQGQIGSGVPASGGSGSGSGMEMGRPGYVQDGRSAPSDRYPDTTAKQPNHNSGRIPKQDQAPVSPTRAHQQRDSYAIAPNSAPPAFSRPSDPAPGSSAAAAGGYRANPMSMSSLLSAPSPGEGPTTSSVPSSGSPYFPPPPSSSSYTSRQHAGQLLPPYQPYSRAPPRAERDPGSSMSPVESRSTGPMSSQPTSEQTSRSYSVASQRSHQARPPSESPTSTRKAVGSNMMGQGQSQGQGQVSGLGSQLGPPPPDNPYSRSHYNNVPPPRSTTQSSANPRQQIPYPPHSADHSRYAPDHRGYQDRRQGGKDDVQVQQGAYGAWDDHRRQASSSAQTSGQGQGMKGADARDPSQGHHQQVQVPRQSNQPGNAGGNARSPVQQPPIIPHPYAPASTSYAQQAAPLHQEPTALPLSAQVSVPPWPPHQPASYGGPRPDYFSSDPQRGSEIEPGQRSGYISGPPHQSNQSNGHSRNSSLQGQMQQRSPVQQHANAGRDRDSKKTSSLDARSNVAPGAVTTGRGGSSHPRDNKSVGGDQRYKPAPPAGQPVTKADESSDRPRPLPPPTSSKATKNSHSSSTHKRKRSEIQAAAAAPTPASTASPGANVAYPPSDEVLPPPPKVHVRKGPLFTPADLNLAAICPPLLKVRSHTFRQSLPEASLAPHLGRFVYSPFIEPERLLDGKLLQANVGGLFEVDISPKWLPSSKWSIGDPSLYTLKDASATASATTDSKENLFWDLEPIGKRRIWGTDVYTDDSDILAICVHSGWIRLNDTPSVAGPGAQVGVAKGLRATVRVGPKLIRYQGCVRGNIASRSWGNGHDGVSLAVERVETIEQTQPVGRGRRWIKKGINCRRRQIGRWPSWNGLFPGTELTDAPSWRTTVSSNSFQEPAFRYRPAIGSHLAKLLWSIESGPEKAKAGVSRPSGNLILEAGSGEFYELSMTYEQPRSKIHFRQLRAPVEPEGLPPSKARRLSMDADPDDMAWTEDGLCFASSTDRTSETGREEAGITKIQVDKVYWERVAKDGHAVVSMQL